MADSDSDVSVVSSSSSDDDFLTVTDKRGGGQPLDREALVRKKLLENFYGRAAVADAAPTKSADDNEDDDEDDEYMSPTSPSAERGGGVNDLDSPAFDADAHTRLHVIHSSMHTLLDTEERLALSVRTLDTEMQALVYENYTRFIDATDAIRSIGVNVQANEEGMDHLSVNMASIDENSRKVEESLGSLRDQVAEKIRVKRLLTRLDTLLNLPQTLREQIADGNCRSACKQFLQASSILSKHSDGFESLKAIEMECNTILEKLRVDLTRKLGHWSGRDAEDVDSKKGPEPPVNMRAVFECSGTLFLLNQHDCKTSVADNGDDEPNNAIASQLQEMSLSACMRLLDRFLDTHMIEIQERRFSSQAMESSNNNLDFGASLTSTHMNMMESGDTTTLVPRHVLDGISKVAELWSACFGEEAAGNADIIEFVSESFASFLMHVRAILLDETMQDATGDDMDSGSDDGITGALSVLVRSVQELAGNLSQPAIGISPDFAKSLADQAASLSDALVRRRIDQKFTSLRQRIVENCLLPFAERARKERADNLAAGKSTQEGLSQIANSTLSECLQLVDDAVRSIVSRRNGNAPSDDNNMILKQAVYGSTGRFVSWLANSFEMLAGGESEDARHLIESHAIDTQEMCDSNLLDFDLDANRNSFADLNDTGIDNRAIAASMDEAYKILLRADSEQSDAVHADFVMAIAEMCRLAQGSISDMLEQSTAVHLGTTHKKKTKGMFEEGKSGYDEYGAFAHRFELAYSRLLIMFATTRGSQVGERIISGLVSKVGEGVTSSAPKESIFDGLELVRDTVVECAEMFGEKAWAGPIDLDDERLPHVSPTAAMARKTGLQLDVERMFKEKPVIYPHPSETILPRQSAIIFLVLKVAFRMQLERVRTLIFDEAGYRQFQVDGDCLALMVSHYLCPDYSHDGNNACASLSSMLSDALQTAGERCVDEECVNNEEIRRASRSIVIRILADKGNKSNSQRIFVPSVAISE